MALNCTIVTDRDLQWNKPGWVFLDEVKDGVRKTHLETDFTVMRMDKLNQKMEEMGAVINKYPAMVTVFGAQGQLGALLNPSGGSARLFLHVESPFLDIGALLGLALYQIPLVPQNQAGDVIPEVQSPVAPNSSTGGVQAKTAPNVPGVAIQAKSQGRVVTDGVGAVKRKQYPVIHPRTKGQDGDDEYYPSEAERKRRATQRNEEQMEEEEEEEEENRDGNISSDGEINVLSQGSAYTQQTLPGYPQYQTIDMGGGNYATAPNVPSAFQQSYFGKHKDQRLSEQGYQQALSSDINQSDIN